MNTNPNAIRILCYGDSNTWGDNPLPLSPRYPSNIRWPGKLQDILGEDYEVIEEGLCGRTTTLDDPTEEGRNGKTYLSPCLLSHNPLDLVILLLGSNDLKERFNLSPQDIALNIDELVGIVKNVSKDRDDKESKILLLSPTIVLENPVSEIEGMFIGGIKGAEEKSKHFGHYYQEVAKKHGLDFIDLAQFVKPSKVEGLHLEAEGHLKIAQIVSEKIKDLSFFS